MHFFFPKRRRKEVENPKYSQNSKQHKKIIVNKQKCKLNTFSQHITKQVYHK